MFPFVNEAAVKKEEKEINVKVVSQLNELDQNFRVKCDVPVRVLMTEWCLRADVKDYRTIRFLHDGKRIHEYQTPNQIGLEDGDSIDAMTEQIGGRSYNS